MKVITCASFYGSGSSALTDLVSEYDCVKDLTNYEFRFLYDLDGVSDLEYHLCESHDRHNSGHALKRFIRLSEFNAGTSFNSRYEPYFNGQYMKLTMKYIDSLIDFSYPGWWFYDVYDKGKLSYYVMMEFEHILRHITKGKKTILNKEKILCSHPSEERFLRNTQQYVASLLRAANIENLPYLEVDQLVPSQNINHVLRYFTDDIYVFIVDRDPRDIYTLNRFYWKDRICPTADVNRFCDWYLYTRESGNRETYDSGHVCKIQFEDLIYKYEESVHGVELFTGLDCSHHVRKFSKFNPLHSLNNTQVWKRHNIYNEISIIEERLKDYLYSFNNVDREYIPGIEKDNMNVF